ncbi:MAG: PspC domain-containing protein [Candidatus Saccharibacteria bacterium]
MTKSKQSKPKELQLDTKDKKFAGVAGGIAEYYDTDPALVRVVAVIFVILTGILPGLIIYGVFYLLMKNTKSKK